MMPNHHITKPVFIGEIQDDGQFEVVWQTPSTVVGDAWSDFLPGSRDITADWTPPLACGNYNVEDRQVLAVRTTSNGADALRSGPHPAGRTFSYLAVLGALDVTKLATTVAVLLRWLVPWAAAHGAPRKISTAASRHWRAPSRTPTRRPPPRRSASSGYPRAEAVLTALLEGELYTTRAGGRLVTAADADGGYTIRDAVTDEDLGSVGRRDVSRVTVNNQLRGTLRSMMASLKLRHEDPDERSAAIREVGESEDLAMIETLEQLLATEEHGGVRSAIAMAVATLNLDSADPAARLAAIESVSTNVSGHVRTKLTAIGCATRRSTTRHAPPRNARWTASSAA